MAEGYPDEPIVQGVLAQITWYNNIALIEKLKSQEEDKYGRLVAEVFVPTQNLEEEKLLNCELVAAGMAYHYKQFSDRCPNGSELLASAEEEAKTKWLRGWSASNAVKS